MWPIVTMFVIAAPATLIIQTEVLPAAKEVKPADESLGLWPSPKLTRLLVRRWATRMGDRYDMDDTQREKLQGAVVDRWLPFLKKHRDDMEPLFEEFVEMRLELSPPSREDAQAWARRALPLLDVLRTELADGADDMREFLTPMQRLKFEAQRLQFALGMSIAEQRLKNFESGEFDADALDDLWKPNASRRRARRKERAAERARKNAKDRDASGPTDQIELELLAWEKYINDFIKQYELNDGQITAVRSCFDELKQRAKLHRERHGHDLDELERRIQAHGGGEQETKELEERLTELYGPIDDMFGELKRRIELIPTMVQRAAFKTRQDQTGTGDARPDRDTPAKDPPVDGPSGETP